MVTVEVDVEWAIRELYDSWEPRTYYYPTAELEAADLEAKYAAVREHYFRKVFLHDAGAATTVSTVDLSGFTRKLNEVPESNKVKLDSGLEGSNCKKRKLDSGLEGSNCNKRKIQTRSCTRQSVRT